MLHQGGSHRLGRNRLRPGATLPPPAPRQTDVRLTGRQRCALRNALTPKDLTRDLLQRFEDLLAAYRRDYEEARSGYPELDAFRQRLTATVKAAEQVLGELPVVMGPARAMTMRLTELETVDQKHDDAFLQELKARVAVLRDCERKVARAWPRGRRPDYWIGWPAFFLVEALDQAGIPLDTGRKTIVVEVVGLFRAYAHALVGREPNSGRKRRPRGESDWKSQDYEFAKMIVESYQRSLRSQNSVTNRAS